MKIQHAAAVVAALIATNACVSADETRTVEYSCADGSALTVSFEGDNAIIRIGEEEVVLKREIVASGFHYLGPRHSLRGKGEEVKYAVGRKAPTTCTEI